MPIGPKGEKRPVNPIEAGIQVARIAVGDLEEEYEEVRPSMPNRANGGKKGGPARAEALTPERRKEIAVQAAAARWEGNPTV